jgi:hypothetical protein
METMLNGEELMNRRTTLMLIGMTGLIIATLPQPGFAQSDPLTGLWQINLAKTKFSPGPGPKSQTLNIQGEGQNRKATVVGITAQGNPQAVVFTEVVEDGKPHAVTGLAGTDAQSYARVDARTLNVSRMKDGKVVQAGTWVVSPDGKTLMVTYTGSNPNGQQINNIFVYDKQ